jgi:hypothetical protein
MIITEFHHEYNQIVGAILFFPVAFFIGIIMDSTEKCLTKFQIGVFLLATVISFLLYYEYCNACTNREFWISIFSSVLVIYIARKASTKVSDILDVCNKINK